MTEKSTTQTTETKPTFGALMKSILYKIGSFFIRYPLAIAGTVLIVAVMIVALFFRQKIQIGGILGWLWNRKTHNPDVVVTTPPPGRVDPSTGEVIQPGQSDAGGWVQAPVVVQIKPPSVFSDPNTITITPPGEPEVTIKLPTGVKNKDVRQIVRVSPTAFEVHNHDKPSVDTKKLLKDL